MEVLVAFFGSFCFSLLALPIVIKVSEKRRLFELPAGRRIHQRITPSRGGIAIFIGFLIGCGLLMYSNDEFFKIAYVLSVPFVAGLLDDHFHIRPLTKLIAQFATAILVYGLLNIKLVSLYGLIDFELNPVLSFIVTCITIVILTNSFNLIDGIDGLAASVSSIILSFYAFWFFVNGESFYCIISLGLLGATLAFLIFNWEPAKIFMGDTGSLVIGTSLSILTIRFINSNYSLPESSALKFNATIPTAISILIIPIVDTLRVIIIRLKLRISPLTADKRHIHHSLLQLGLSHRQAVVTIVSLQVCFLLLALVLQSASNGLILLLVITLAVALCILLQRFIARQTIAKLASD